MIDHAVRNKLFDTVLKKEKWFTSLFRFAAGDLFDVIPLLKTKYYPTTVVDAYCNFSTSDSDWPSAGGDL